MAILAVYRKEEKKTKKKELKQPDKKSGEGKAEFSLVYSQQKFWKIVLFEALPISKTFLSSPNNKIFAKF